jgi:23S rRNA (pseudouridine1915-N3)-methyltransferase
MAIKLLLIGKTEEEYIRQGCAVYEKRIGFYSAFDIKVLPGTSLLKGNSAETIKQKEADQVLKEISTGDFLILLDENGKQYSSREFSTQLEKLLMVNRNIVFVIGGAFGFAEKLTERANSMISLSKMTFTHQMVRLIFLEQLYRAFTIIRGEKYHHD